MERPNCKLCGHRHYAHEDHTWPKGQKTVKIKTTPYPDTSSLKNPTAIEKRLDVLEDRIEAVEFAFQSIKEDARKYAKIRANQRERMARKRRKK